MRSILSRLFLVPLLITFSLNVRSQVTQSDSASFERTFSMFREPSYITAMGGIGNIESLVFEADVIPYFMLSLNKNNRWGIELSPRILLRMYNEKSYPVRTPSFMPRATFFYRVSSIRNKSQDVFTYISWCHHSNGQDGEFYNPDSITINLKSGSFSTNLIEGGLFLSHPDRRFPKVAINYLKISANYHYQPAKELRGIYGRWRFLADFQSSINLSKALRIFGRSANNSASHNAFISQSIRVGWIGGDIKDFKPVDDRRLIFRYTISYKPSFLNDVTLFAQYYYGEDYYNINFSRTLKVFRIGLSAKTSMFN